MKTAYRFEECNLRKVQLIYVRRIDKSPVKIVRKGEDYGSDFK